MAMMGLLGFNPQFQDWSINNPTLMWLAIQIVGLTWVGINFKQSKTNNKLVYFIIKY
jgi:hypothetical protein